MIKVLVSDDNEKLFAPWTEQASKFDIDLNCFNNWEEAQFELKERWNEYDFVILDGKGKITEEESGGNKKHLIAAVQWLKEQRGVGLYKPAIVYTGYYKDIDEIAIIDDQVLEIFDKGETESNEIFKFILKEVKKSPDKIIKSKYPDVFEIFDKKYLDPSVEKMLLHLLKSADNISPDKLPEYATQIRSIQEALYKNLNYYFPNILSNDCFKANGMIEFNKAKNTLSPKIKDTSGRISTDKAKDIQGNDIENLSNCIYWVCGNIIHYEKDKIYEPSKYIIISLIFALLEQLLWYKNTVERLLNN